MRNPVVGRVSVALLVILWRLPNIPVPKLIVLGASGLFEPLDLVTGMVHDKVHKELHPPVMASFDQRLDIGDRTVFISNAVVVGNVIAHVHLRGLVRRAEPDNVHPEVLDVVKLRDNTGNIANTVIIGVLVGSWPDLVYGAFLPPGSVDLIARFGHDEVCHVEVRKQTRADNQRADINSLK